MSGHPQMMLRATQAYRTVLKAEAGSATIIASLAVAGGMWLPYWWRLPLLIPSIFGISVALRYWDRMYLLRYVAATVQLAVLRRDLDCTCTQFKHHLVVCPDADCEVRTYFREGNDSGAAAP